MTVRAHRAIWCAAVWIVVCSSAVGAPGGPVVVRWQDIGGRVGGGL